MKNYKQLPWQTEEEFYDLHAESFFSTGKFYHSNMIGNTDDYFLNYIISKLNLKPTDNVVDLGCGSGYLVNEINKICNCEGISTSKKSIEIAKRNFPDCIFNVADMENFKAKDAVTHFLSLESIGYSDIKKTLSNVFSQLIDGGIFYVKDTSIVNNPCKEEQENLVYWTNYWKYKTYTVPEMIHEAYLTGFKLNTFRDLHLDTRLNIKSFMDTLKNNIIPEKYPYPDYVVHIGTEFIFQKKKREKWVNPYT